MNNTLNNETVNKIKESIESYSANKLYEEISKQNTVYITIISIMLTFILTIVGAYIWQQLKFSDKGIEKIEKKFEKEFKKTFKIEEKDKKIKKLTESLHEAQKTTNQISNTSESIDKKMKKFKKDSVEAMMRIDADLFEMNNSNNSEILLGNKINNLRNISRKMKEVQLDEQDLSNCLVSINNGIINGKLERFEDKKNIIKDGLQETAKAFEEQSKIYPKNDKIKQRVQFIKDTVEKVRNTQIK
ncbi:hypothetical protein DY037_08060 [Apilactobacillus micheneri]|uniref:hypothetical protein n=1 Tax=Apilactobacillus micheneri TaxID=1899430 RepID=UPI001129FC85|nr:hypothetical protein [Apilactobacillus micheneri]TPR47832.1 hypothetical protein DY037_08060 [Apilactobacillus micheneri]